MNVKEKTEKADLKPILEKNQDHGIQFHNLLTNGETMETVTGIIFFGSRITGDGDCSY